MKISRLLLGILVLLVLGAAVRGAYLALRYPQTIGGERLDNKRIAVSPDSQYAAFALTYKDVSFWGKSMPFYEFRIMHLPDDILVRSFRVFPPDGDPVHDYSQAGSFAWSKDSLGVEVGMFGAEMRIQAIGME